jgi:hypothetical protein
MSHQRHALSADFSKGALPWTGERSPRGLYAAHVESLAAQAMGLDVAHSGARDFASDSILGAVLDLLHEQDRARGLRLGRDNGEIYSLAMMTGDLPMLLGDIANRAFQGVFETIATTAQRVCREVSLTDFRPARVISLDLLPGLVQVGEGGEVVEGTLADSGQTVQLLRFSRIFRFSRELIANNDLLTIGNMVVFAARRARTVPNDLLFVQLLRNSALGPTLADGLSMFHATHANVTAAGALDKVRLSEARALVKNQESAGVPLNAPARYLLVSPEKQTDVEEMLASLAPGQSGPDAEPVTVLSDSNLSGSTRFYALADPRVGSNFVLGKLAGTSGAPSVVAQEDFAGDSVAFKVTTECVIGGADYRYAATGAGA